MSSSKLKRYPDWPTRYQDFLLDNRERPFQWGTWDCCLFVCGVIAAITGTDPAESFRGRYKSEIGAKRIAKRRFGAASFELLEEKMAEEYGMPEIKASMASRGDVVIVKQRSSSLLGIIDLNGIEPLVLTDAGIWRAPRPMAVRAWRV